MSRLLPRESFVMTGIVFRHWGKMFWFPLGSYFHDDNQIRFLEGHIWSSGLHSQLRINRATQAVSWHVCLGLSVATRTIGLFWQVT